VRKVLTVQLPAYSPSRTSGDRPRTWRQNIHRALNIAKKTGRVKKLKLTDHVAMRASLWFPRKEIDLDNALKHLLDALQGAIGGEGKKTSRHKRLVPNDNQIYRISATKHVGPAAKDSAGHVTISVL